MEELCAGYFSNSLSPEELEELKAAMGSSPENEKQFRMMQEIWFSSISASDHRRFDKDKAWRRFLAHTGKAKETERRKKSWRILWQSVAAVALLLMASYVSFRLGDHQPENIQFADIHIESSWGSRVKTYLPDGTLVWLNADSKLTYSQGFGIHDRNVRLYGEGYFEVTHHENLPFSVQTDELQVHVLGTKFNFRNYSDDKEASVCLLEGKIRVGSHVRQGEDLIMEPDQKVFLNKKSGEIYQTKVYAGNTVEWTTGHLFFDEDLLPDIARELERSYDVKITIHPDLKNLRFYGNFSRKEMTIKDVLDKLVSTGRIKYRMAGNEINIIPIGKY